MLKFLQDFIKYFTYLESSYNQSRIKKQELTKFSEQLKIAEVLI